MNKFTGIVFLLAAFCIIVLSYYSTVEEPEWFNIQHVELKNADDIIDLTDSLVVPVLYDTLLIDQLAPVNIQKKQFINQLVPAILIVRYELEQKSNVIISLIEKISNEEHIFQSEYDYADSLLIVYRADSYEKLLIKLKPHPVSLVLAQAALESGWGRSRLVADGFNLFGVLSVASDPNSIKTGLFIGGNPVFMKKYNSVAESIDHYYLNIGRHNAYRAFRQMRYKETDVFELVHSLENYSELGSEYTFLLQKMIKWNNFDVYDSYIIDPNYFVKQTKLDVLIDKFKMYVGNTFTGKRHENAEQIGN